METAHRSAHPNIPGVRWWTGLLIAVTATAIGYGIDAGHKELTHVFAGFYIAGCVAAVLAVRQEDLFTAIIQPPLILFCAVPGAYWLFHGGKIGHLKDVLVNCGYPLIERFPLMLGTAGGVLLIGLLRWYFGVSHRLTSQADTADAATDASARGARSFLNFLNDIAVRLRSLLRPESGGDEYHGDESDGEAADAARSSGARRGRAGGAPATRRRATRGAAGTTRSTRTRSRTARHPLDDELGVRPEGPRRARRRGEAATRDHDAAEGPRRARRRPRPESVPDPRDHQPPGESRREPRQRRNPYERSAPRSSRFDGYDRYDPPGAPARYGTPEQYDRHDPAHEPRRRRPANGAGSYHHPISQVRYRADAPVDESRAEPSGRYRPGSRSNNRSTSESWE